MAIEDVTGQRVPPGAALVAEIDRRRGDAMVKMSGLAPVLDMLRAYIVGTEARLSALEAVPRVVDVVTLTERREFERQR